MPRARTLFFWALPVAAQIAATVASRNRYSYEELAESIRNPFWLENHTIYDGISSNIGWYELCLIMYRLFGMSLYSAKILRLALHMLSMVSLMAVLRRYLGERRFLLPFLTIGMSPTLLYYTTFQTPLGIDLQWAMITSFLLASIDPSRITRSAMLHGMLGAVVMMACMCYPSFLTYLPVLGLLLGALHRRFFRSAVNKRPWLQLLQLGVAPVAALSVFVAAVSYVKDLNLLLMDPDKDTGIFRSSGGGGFSFSGTALLAGLEVTLRDLLVKGNSYYFYLKQAEFRNFLGWTTAALVLVGSLAILIVYSRLRLQVGLAYLLLFFGLVVPNFLPVFPGLRRCTAVLVGFYSLLVIVWEWTGSSEARAHPRLRRSAMLLGMLLLMHHLWLFPGVLNHLKQESRSWREFWLQVKPTPEQSLQFWVDKVKEKGPLSCRPDDPDRLAVCRFSELYAALAGHQLWNQQRTPEVLAIDPKTGRLLPLSTELWESYYFSH